MIFIRYDVEERLNSFKEHELTFVEIGVLHYLEMVYAASGEIPLSEEKIFEIADWAVANKVLRYFFEEVEGGYVPLSYVIETIEKE